MILLVCGGSLMKKIIFVLSIILVGFLIFGCTSMEKSYNIADEQKSVSELKLEAIDISYDELFRNNELYVGKVVHFPQVELIQVLNNSKTSDFRANIYLNRRDSQDTVYLRNYSGSRLLEEDVVEVFAVVEGIMEYKTVLGDIVSLPKLKVLEITRCGTEGLSPCASSLCVVDYEDFNGSCTKMCTSYTTRIDGNCVACGSRGQPCCNNNSCSSFGMIGYTCEEGICK